MIVAAGVDVRGWWGAAILTAGFLGLVAWPVLANWQRDCFNAWDLAIYSQAIQRISWADFNPWLPVRGVRIFNDHFEPVLVLVAPLARVLDPSLAAIVADLVFVVAAGLTVFGGLRSRDVAPGLALLACGLVLFGRGTVSAVIYPAHPMTWSLLPLMGLALATARAHRPAVVASVLVLFVFREEFVFVGLGLGLYYLGVGDRRLGVRLLTAAAAWSVVVFVLRPWFFGDTMPYASAFLKTWASNPRGTLGERLSDASSWRVWGETILPAIPLLWWLRRQRLPLNHAMLVGLLPLVAIRIISGRLGLHHAVILSAWVVGSVMSPGLVRSARRDTTSAVGAASAADAGEEPVRRLGRAVIVSAVLAVVVQVPSLGRYAWRTTLGPGLSRCRADPTRLADLAEAREAVAAYQRMPVFAMGNLAPRLLSHGDVRHFETSDGELPHGPFLVLLEKRPGGDPWPIGHEGVTARLDTWRRTRSAAVLLDRRHVILWKFSPEHPASAAPGPHLGGLR